MPAAEHVPEIALSDAWHRQQFTGPLCTTDGRLVEVVFRGTWTHGFGPDFCNAIILFEGREMRHGSIEVHRRTSGWAAHGHHVDPRYDDVILHVVLDHDGAETRRSDGRVAPVIELRGLLTGPLAEVTAADATWDRFGGESCAPELAQREPGRVAEILWRLGDQRLAAKAARLQARLTAETPGQVLYAEIWDGLGFSQNREPMRELAVTLPLVAIESTVNAHPPSIRTALARGLLLGAAGLLPLSPVDASFAHLAPADVVELERCWERYGTPWSGQTQAPTAWTRARVRPANHPVTRLAAGANMLAAASGGLVAELLSPVRSAADATMALRELTKRDSHPGIGADRAIDLVVNALLPLAFALAEQTDDGALIATAASLWERLAASESNAVTRRALGQVTGGLRLRPLGARGQQGLIHLDQTLCAPRRCFECPIAGAVLADAVVSPAAVEDAIAPDAG